MIAFEPLAERHFPLLYKWLMMPHVRRWWDTDVPWTPELIAAKYSHYARGVKRLELPSGVIEKPMHATIMTMEGKEIGYIQVYDKHDFPPRQGYDMQDLPKNLAAIDWYIGEIDYTNKGIGTNVLTLFLQEHVWKQFPAAFVEPDVENSAAIRVYEKVGFEKIKTIEDKGIVWMMKRKEKNMLS